MNAARLAGRFSRSFGRLLKIALAVLILALVTIDAALILLEFPKPQAFVLDKVNRAISDGLRGEVVIDAVSDIDLSGLDGARGRVLDPAQRQVVSLRGVQVEFDAWPLLVSLVRGGALRLDIERITVRRAEVVVREGQDGQLTLVTAFEPVGPEPDAKAPPGRAVALEIDAIHIRQTRVQGRWRSYPVDVELSDTRLSLRSTEQQLALTNINSRLRARQLPQGVDPDGRISGQLVFPEEAAFLANARFHGRVAQVPLTLEGRSVGEQVSVSLLVPTATPSAMRDLLPEYPLDEPLSVSARARGTLEQLQIELSARAGKSTLQATSRVQLQPELQGTVRARMQHFDLRVLRADVPPATGSARLVADFDLAGERPQGSFRVALNELTVMGRSLPDLKLAGSLRRGTLRAHASAASARGPLDLDVKVAGLFARERRVSADLELALAALGPLLPGTPRNLQGRLSASASGSIAAGRVNVSASGELRGFRFEAFSARHVTFTVAAAGAPSRPELEFVARVRDAERGDVHVDSARVRVQGTPQELALSATLRGAGSTRLDITGQLHPDEQRLTDLAARVSRSGVELTARARSVSLEDGVAVRDLVVSGPGEARISLSSSAGETSLQASGKGMNLEQIGRFAGIDIPSGALRFDADLRMTERGLDGQLEAELVRGSYAGLRALAGALRLRAEHGLMDARAWVSSPELGEVRAKLEDFRVPGKVFEPVKWVQSSGELEIDGKLDLGRVPTAGLAPFGVQRLRGRARLDVKLARAAPESRADADLYLELRRFELRPADEDANRDGDARPFRVDPRLRLAGIDLSIDARTSAVASETVLFAELSDLRGELLWVSAFAPLSAEDLVQRAREGDPLRLPVRARAVVPCRQLDQMPGPLRLSGVRGSVELEARADGLAEVPNLSVVGRGAGLGPKSPDYRLPLDVMLRARHVPGHSIVSVQSSSGGQQLLHARAKIDGSLSDLARGRAFDAEARARFAGFPLHTIPALRERQIEGLLSGDVLLRGLGSDAELHAKLAGKHVRLGTLDCRTARMELHAADGRLKGEAELVHDGGFLRAHAEAGLHWRGGLVPELPPDKQLSAQLHARNFRARALLPLVHDTFSDLDGLVDANVRVARSETGETAISGRADFRDGVVQIPALGQQIRDIRGRVEAAPGGLLRIQDVSARPLSGRIRAAASARLNGLALTAANARVRIAEDEKISLTSRGVSIGDAWGALDVALRTNRDGGRRIRVDARRMTVALDRDPSRNIQELEPAPHIRVGVLREDGEFERLRLSRPENVPGTDPVPLILSVDLGEDVWIQRGNQLRVKLDGGMRLEIEPEIDASGRLRIERGVIDVQGKQFEIESGTVTFTGDPANPLLVARARHDSPAGYRVFAEYTGRVEDGQLTLRSEPPLTDDQILSLLLFGTPDGTLGGQGGGGGDAALAVSAAGGVATKSLNRALNDLTELDVTTRIDTSHGSPRPELVLQLTRRLSASIEYVVGEPALYRQQDRTFLTLDFRITGKWSLATTVGNRGSTIVDLIWRHRY